jgi:hypothetical protein
MNLKFEPALVVGFVRACLYALALFGFDLSEEQIIGLVAVVETGGALFIRSSTVTKGHVEQVLEHATTSPAQDQELSAALGVEPPS